MKKCKKCGAPLEGFLYQTIGKLMGIKPSEQDPEVCNKCAEAPESAAAQPSEQEVKPEAPSAVEDNATPVETTDTPMASEEEKKEEGI